MKLSSSFEKGVCILALLSTQKRNVALSAEVINSRINVSASYIKKIIRKLVVAKIIVSVSGNNGGFSLAKKPNHITLHDVVVALEGHTDTYPNSGLFNATFRGLKGAKVGDAFIHHIIKEADNRWSEYLKGKTISDVIKHLQNEELFTVVDWNSFSRE
jgi:Rrf2 family protein